MPYSLKRPVTAACLHVSAYDYNLLTLVNSCKSRSPLDRWTHVLPVVWNSHCNLGYATEEEMEMAARWNQQTNHGINETCTHAWPPKSNPNTVSFIISIVVVKLNQRCGPSLISGMTWSRKLINAIHLPACFYQHTQSSRWAGWHRQLLLLGGSALVPLTESTAALITQLEKKGGGAFKVMTGRWRLISLWVFFFSFKSKRRSFFTAFAQSVFHFLNSPEHICSKLSLCHCDLTCVH